MDLLPKTKLSIKIQNISGAINLVGSLHLKFEKEKANKNKKIQ